MPETTIQFLGDIYDIMSVERRDIVEKAYKAYKDLGGNGSIDHMFDVLKNIDPFIVNPTTHNDDEV